MAINKVVFGDNTLIDLTDTTATESDVAKDKIFHKKDGTIGSGTAIISDYNCKAGALINGAFANNITKIGHLVNEGASLFTQFANMQRLEEVEEIELNGIANIGQAFIGCIKLKKAPKMNTSSVSIMRSMFENCTALEDLPLYDTSNTSDMRTMFSGCTSLTDASLNNILQMCANAVNYSRTKTLVAIGITSTNYSASRIQNLSNYQAFINAGWTTGF